MGSLSGAPLKKLKVVDFSGLDPSSPGSERWVAVRGEVMAAIELYGCFEAVAEDGVTTEMREVVFGWVMKEVYGTPREEKLREATTGPWKFLHEKHPVISYESVGIHDCTKREAVRSFGELLWPQGINPATFEVICSFTNLLWKLDHIVRIMMLESLGIQKHIDSVMESNSYLLRLSKYGPRPEGSASGLLDHTDPTMTTIVCQHQLEGLEIQGKDGHRYVPSRDSINFMIGDLFEGWTNGRIEPCLHGVRDVGNNVRFAILFGSQPRDGYITKVPEELVSEEHPLKYKPYTFDQYIKFRYVSNSTKQTERALKYFCGADVESKEKLEA